MSARSERLVEQINELNERIEKLMPGFGEQARDELEKCVQRRGELLSELKSVLGQLSEGKVLKG